jgi:Flp pilus assembly pilin Flp
MEPRDVTHIAGKFGKFLRDSKGATAIEYALIASIMGVMIVPVLSDTTSGVASLYATIRGLFDSIN